MGLDAPAAEVTITPDEVRRMTLRAQGFLGATSRRGGVAAMLRRVGAVQLDTISVLARSHELVAYARLGAVSRSQIEQAYWHAAKPAAFEYWAHAACVLPIEQWPYFAFRRRALRARGIRWHRSHAETCDKVLARLRAEGPPFHPPATRLTAGSLNSRNSLQIACRWLERFSTGFRAVAFTGKRRLRLSVLFNSVSVDRHLELELRAGAEQGEARVLGKKLNINGLSVEVAGEIDGEGHGAAGQLSVDIAMAGRRADVDPVILSAGHRSPGKGHGSRGMRRTRSRRHQLRMVDSGRWGQGRGLELVLGTGSEQGEARVLGKELNINGLPVEGAGERPEDRR